MKKLSICLLLFAFSLSTFAQSNFKPGFIITNENDSIFGEVDYQSNSKNYQICIFRNNSNITEYQANQITGYGITNDKYYASGIVEGSFVEVLVRGDLDLYRYGSTYFIKKDGELHKLENEDENGNKNETKWKGLISYLLNDCLKDPSFIRSISLNEKALTKLSIEYNECKGSEYVVYKEDKPWTEVDYGVVFGLTKSTINFAYSDNFLYMKDQYTSVDPFVGLMLSLSFPRLSDRIAIQAEVLYSKSHYTALIEEENYGNGEYHETFMNVSTISIPLYFKYSIPTDFVEVQLYAGINYDYHTKTETRVISEYVYTTGVVRTVENPAFEIDKSQIGFWGGLSVMKPIGMLKPSLGIRYHYMSNFSKSSNLLDENNKLSLAIILQKK